MHRCTAILFFTFFMAVGITGCQSTAPDDAQPAATRESRPPKARSAASLRLDITATRQVVEKALGEMGWPVMSVDQDPVSLDMRALTPDDRTVSLSAKLTELNQVKLYVRVGYYGDVQDERALLTRIRQVAGEMRGQERVE